MAVLTESADGREISLSPGESFEVCLEERPTTGFRWQIVSDGAPLCVLVSDSFAAPKSHVPGRAGHHSWTFRIEHPGRATVELASRRPWEKQKPPARAFRLTVIATD
jgi:inhibitor of cysteine peptidase